VFNEAIYMAKIRSMNVATKTKTPKAGTNGVDQGGSIPVATEITIPRIAIREMDLTLVGDSSLITNKWSEKAKKEMAAAHAGEAKAAREPKNPKQSYEDSMYRLDDGSPAYVCSSFKAAAVAACRFVKGDIAMTEARGAFHVVGEFVKIDGKPNMREDMVRIKSGADIRYRAEFKEWAVTLRIRYNAGALSAAQIVNLFNIAGFGVGVGEWRPSSKSGGPHGMFHVATEEDSA
jgi:hypothetical protein